ncbi:MAG: (2Fe-2S)-binding protein [Saprospiraceae bacterium]|nr:(2Fe-2S)-binding protein [Saprospiraceae bacterium]
MKEGKKKGDSAGSTSGLSRRGFLRGAGLTTAGTVVLNNGLLAFDSKAKMAKGRLYPADAADIMLRVNGREYALKVEPRTTLADTLRYQLGLTGTKVVCDRGSCSACTVYLDGKPVNSCMTLVLDVKDQEVTTIEGIAKGDELHPVQEAFIDHDASQCGYCTPGMVMSCVHLLENNPAPTLEDVKHATRGNLCRCGTYPHVFKATLAAAAKMK